MRLFIGTPTQSTWSPEFGHSLSWLMSDLAGNPAGLELVHHAWMDGTLLPGLRMDLASRALEMGATHILWTDCDMKFKPKSVRALFDHSELDIVAPHEFCAIAMDGKYMTPRSKGLEPALYAGMGLMLTKVKVFEQLPQPWFLQPFNPATEDYIGEDVWFCKVAADAGFKTIVSHDASIGVGHVSKQVLTLDNSVKRNLELVK